MASWVWARTSLSTWTRSNSRMGFTVIECLFGRDWCFNMMRSQLLLQLPSFSNPCCQHPVALSLLWFMSSCIVLEHLLFPNYCMMGVSFLLLLLLLMSLRVQVFLSVLRVLLVPRFPHDGYFTASASWALCSATMGVESMPLPHTKSCGFASPSDPPSEVGCAKAQFQHKLLGSGGWGGGAGGASSAQYPVSTQGPEL